MIDSPPSSCIRQTSEIAELRILLTTKPGSSPQAIGSLRMAWANVVATCIVSGGGVLALDDLDEAHHRRGIKK